MIPEHKEMAIWAGGTAVLVIAAWVWLGSRGGAVGELRDQVESAHTAYTGLYLDEDGDRLPEADAIALFEQQRDAQLGELAAVEAVAVWPGDAAGVPPEFTGFHFGTDDGGGIDYATAIDKVSRVASRLRRRAESLGVEIPPELPLEGEGDLSTDEDALRNLQMAHVCTFAALLDLALDVGVKRISTVQVVSDGWSDSTGHYAVIPVSAVVTTSYESVDELMRRLAANRFGLGLERLALDYDESGSFRATVAVHLIVPNRADWNLPERGDAPAERGSSSRATTRGATRGTRGSRP
ncbi:MAG: hypothetical protein PF961_07390 [Planctomycetota bacterium]|jgi:hypothetical protein|nr:hypothetical protein [Planctomycetota bacterium]